MKTEKEVRYFLQNVRKMYLSESKINGEAPSECQLRLEGEIKAIKFILAKDGEVFGQDIKDIEQKGGKATIANDRPIDCLATGFDCNECTRNTKNGCLVGPVLDWYAKPYIDRPYLTTAERSFLTNIFAFIPFNRKVEAIERGAYKVSEMSNAYYLCFYTKNTVGDMEKIESIEITASCFNSMELNVKYPVSVLLDDRSMGGSSE